MEEKELVLKRAKNAVIARDFVLAARLYKGLLSEDAKNIELLFDLGNVYIKSGDDAKAVPYFEQILTFSPNNFSALNSLGGCYRRLGKYDKAIATLQKAIDTGENNAEANYNLGFAYKAMGNTEAAIDCFNSVIEANPDDVLAYNHLGSIYAQKNEQQKAIAIYKKGLQVDPNHPILQYNLARSYEAVHDDVSAVAAYENALKSKPGWVDAVVSYAKLLLSHRKTRSAGEIVKNTLGLHPEDSMLNMLLGKVLLLQNNYNEAIASCEKSNKINPNSIEILSLLAQAYEKGGRAMEALESIMKAQDLDEDNIPIKKQAVHVMLSAGKVEDAGRALKKISNNWKKDPELLDLAGQYYILKKKDENAQACQKKAKQVDSSYTDIYSNYALRYKQINELEKARKQIKLFIDENMKDVSAWILLGQIDESMGNYEEAADDFSTAIAFDPNNYLASYLSKRLEEKTCGTKVQKTAEAKESSSIGEEISLDEFGLEDLTGEEPSSNAAKITENKVEESENSGEKDFEVEENPDILKMDEKNALFSDKEKSSLEEPEDFESLEELDGAGVPEELEATQKAEDFNHKENESAEPISENKEENEKDSSGLAEEAQDFNYSDVLEDEPAEEQKSAENIEGFEISDPSSQIVEELQEPEDLTEKEELEPEDKVDVSNEENEAVDSETQENSEDAAEESDDFNFDDLFADSENSSSEQSSKDSATVTDSNKIQSPVVLADSRDSHSEEKAAKHAGLAALAAEKAWKAAEKAADAAQAAENLTSHIEETAEKAVKEASGKQALNQMEALIPDIAKMIENPEHKKRFEKEIQLFETLRKIGQSLPEPQLSEFLKSKTRVLLEYLIARLSGRQGLYKIIKDYYRCGLIEENVEPLNESELCSLSEKELASRNLKFIKNFVYELNDKELAEGLSNMAEELYSKLN